MLDLHAFQRDVDAFGHPTRAEVEMLRSVTAELGAQEVFVTGNVRQYLAQQHLAHATPVIRRGIDEVHAQGNRDMDAPQRLVEIHAAELGAERRSSEGKLGQIQLSLSETASFHSNDSQQDAWQVS